MRLEVDPQNLNPSLSQRLPIFHLTHLTQQNFHSLDLPGNLIDSVPLLSQYSSFFYMISQAGFSPEAFVQLFNCLTHQAGGRRAVREAESFCNGVVFTRCQSLYLCLCVFLYFWYFGIFGSRVMVTGCQT